MKNNLMTLLHSIISLGFHKKTTVHLIALAIATAYIKTETVILLFVNCME